MAPDDRSPTRGIVSGESRQPGGGLPLPLPEPPAETEADERLLQSARAGDREAFRGLVEMHQDRMFRLMRRMLRCDRDTASDLTQEVFLRVYRGLPGFDGRSKFTTWLYKIAINVGISQYRHRRAMKRGRWTFSIDAPVPGTDGLLIEPAARKNDPADRAHDKDVGAAVRAAVAELPDEFRQAVVLRDLQGLSYEEIAAALDVPPGTVRSRIHRGRLILQDRLRAYRP